MNVIVTGAFEWADRLEMAAHALPENSRIALRTGGELLKSGLQEQFLSGQYLNVRSDRLRSSWQVMDAPAQGDDIAVAVTSNTPYAARHEFGFEGHENVREHTRMNPKKAAEKRKRAASRAGRLNPKGQARYASEQRARARDKAAAKGRAPGLGIARRMRRETGEQRGVSGGFSRAFEEKHAGSGKILVRAHGRWARTRARHYARDASIRFAPAVEEQYRRVLLSRSGLGE